MAKQKNEETALTVFRKETDLSGLPEQIRKALSKFNVKTKHGIAPTWNPTKEGEFILGTVSSLRKGVGKYQSDVITLDTVGGPFAIWISADLKTKLGEDPVGKHLVIQFQGKLQKKDNPSLANDMKLYHVMEVEPE